MQTDNANVDVNVTASTNYPASIDPVAGKVFDPFATDLLVLLDSAFFDFVRNDAEASIYRPIRVHRTSRWVGMHRLPAYPDVITEVRFANPFSVGFDVEDSDDGPGITLVRYRPVALCFPVTIAAEADAKVAEINSACAALAVNATLTSAILAGDFKNLPSDLIATVTGVPDIAPGQHRCWERFLRMTQYDHEVTREDDDTN